MTSNTIMYFGNHGKELYERIKEKLGNSYWPKFNVTGITFYGPKNSRILKLVYRRKNIMVEFNVPVSPVPGLTILSEQEARTKKMGTCQWIYEGHNPDLLLKLIEEAIRNY